MYPTEPLYFCGREPEKAHQDDAAYDLYADQAMRIPAGEGRIVSCGVVMAIPEGVVGLVCSRSGIAYREGVFVLNAPGVIDPGYRGVVSAILYNLGPRDFDIAPGDRIAQLLLVPTRSYRMTRLGLNDLPETERGTGGFGSTGVA